MLNAVLALNDLDTKVFDSPIPGEAPRIYDDHVTIPDAHLLFNGQFQRVGSNDLKIVGEDGQSFFIQDYFASETRAHLMSPQGATLSASVVEALAGPLAPGQHAQAGGQPASTQPVIGRVDALSGSATVVRNGVTVSLNVGDTVRKGDVVQTSGGSSVAIVFTDGSTFSLNANARMVLDEFVYAAGGTGNSALISLVQGTFSFVAGQVAKTGDMKVETPVATMGIRGTAVLVEISANDGQTRFSVMVEPDGTTGAFNLYNKTTGALIGTVSNSQVGWVVTPAGPLQVVAQQVQKTPGELAQELGIVQQIFTIFNNNQQNPFVPTQDRGDNPNDTNPQTAQGGGGSSTPPAGSTTSNNPLVDVINTASNNPSTAPSSATIPLPTNPLPGANPGSPPPVVTVTVSPNKPPVAVDDPDGTPGGGNVITPTNPEAPGTDLDPEGGNISVTTAQHVVRDEGGNYVPAGDAVQIDADGEPIEGTYGTLTLLANGSYTFEPNDAFRALAAGEQATDTFQYTITDPFGLTASAVLTIKLTGENDAPVVSGAVTGNATEDGAAVTLDALANASDVDAGTTLSVVDVPVNLPAGVTFDSETGTFTLDPSNAAYQSLAAGQQTTVTVNYGVSDGTATTTASVSWTVTGTNDAPVANNDTAEMNENDVLFVDVLTNDAQGATTKLLKSLGTVTIDGPDDVVLGTPAIVIENNQIRITPGTAFDALAAGETATITVPYTMQTGAGEVLTATATITVTGTNDAPYFSLLPDFDSVGTINTDGSFQGTAALMLTTAGANVAAIETFLGLDHGTLAATSAQNAPGNLNLNPTEGSAIAFDLVMAAGETITFSWNFASTEYTPFNDFAFFTFAPSFGDKLADIFMIGDNANDGFMHSSGWIEYSFTATSAGNYRLGIGVIDTGDTAFDSQLYISGFSGLGFSRTVDEDAGIQTFNLLQGALDPDTNDELSAVNIAVTATDQNGNPVTVTGAYSIDGGVLTIDPGFFDYLGSDQHVTIVASYGVTDGIATVQNSATLVVEGVNDAPVANAVSASGNEDTSAIAIELSGSDIDGTISHFKLNSLPLHGDLSLDGFSTILDEEDLQQTISAYEGKGTIYFRPHDDWNGQTTFDYVAVDNNEAESEAATATVNVAALPETVTITVETNAGYNLEEFVSTLLQADVTDISCSHITLYYSGDYQSISDDLVFEVTAENLTYQSQPNQWEGEDFRLTGGTITSIAVLKPVDGPSVPVAEFDGFDISATDLQSAIDYYDQHEGDDSAIEAIFGSYSYQATGGNGPDILTTGDSDDVIDGGAGCDVIDGQGGNDTLTGGEGADRFVFNVNYGSDKILDFQSGQDTIQIGPELAAVIGQEMPSLGEIADEAFAELFENGATFGSLQFGIEGQDALIQVGTDSLRIANVVVNDQLVNLHVNDFVIQSYGI